MTFHNIFQYRMPAGIPGQVTRIQAAVIEPAIASTAHPPAAYGIPVVIDQTHGRFFPEKAHTGQVRPIGRGERGGDDKAEDVYGFLVRPFPTQQAGEGKPITSVCDVLVRGYINVKLNGVAEAWKNGAVYARINKPTDDQPLGGIEAAPDDQNTIQLIDTHFLGEADAHGNVEIAYKM